MDIALVMFTHKGERRDFPVKGNKAVIGRSAESDIQIPLSEVSRRHCELTVKKDQVFIRDLGSSNGTYVNNKRIQQAELGAGETVTVGPVVFTLTINGSPEEIKPVRTVVPAKKKAENKVEKSPVPDLKDDTGSVDLHDSGTLAAEADDDGSLAALEELSKQRKGKP